MSLNIQMTGKGEALWKQLTDAGCRAYVHGSVFLSKRSFSNFSELLDLGNQGGLSGMMRASGIDEAFVTGGASDYDKLEALCEVLHLWSGHPSYAAIHAMLRRVFDIDLPLNPQTLPEIWQRTVKHLLENPLFPADLPALWGIKKTITSLPLYDLTDVPSEALDESTGDIYLHIKDLIHTFWYPPYESPISYLKPAEDMAARVEAFVDQYVTGRCAGIALDLSNLSTFVRPDPYSPAQAVLRLQRDPKSLREPELHLIYSQTLRLIAAACVKRNLKMTLLRASSEALYPLCSYLHGCGCLPTTTVAVARPYDLSSLGITPMLYLPDGIPPELVTQDLTVLAAKMPLGTLRGLYMPICAPLDLPLWAEAGRTLCECVVKFGELGRGTRDNEEQAMILQNVFR